MRTGIYMVPMARLKVSTIAGIRAKGVNYAPGAGMASDHATVLARALQTSVVDGTRPALLFAAGVVAIGAFLSLLIPVHGPAPSLVPVPVLLPGS